MGTKTHNLDIMKHFLLWAGLTDDVAQGPAACGWGSKLLLTKLCPTLGDSVGQSEDNHQKAMAQHALYSETGSM